MRDIGGRMALLLWAVAAVASAVAVWRTDGLVAVGFERFTGPLAFLLLHVPAAAAAELTRRLVARWLPRVASLVAPLVPAALIGLVWMRGLVEEVASPPAAAAKGAAGPDIVLITLDTVRADHVGAIGGGTLTPNLDALGARGTVFTQAITTSPVTAPAHASMLTGLDVPGHQLWEAGVTLQTPTVVEPLRAAGYRTGAFVAAHALDRETGLHRGFHHYDDRWGIVQRLRWLPGQRSLDAFRLEPRRSGAQTVDQALRWMVQDDTPALMWVHLYDAHGPYRPPSQFQPSAEARAEARRLDREDLRAAGDVRVVGWSARTRVREQSLLYAASVQWVDALVGRLVGRLRGDPIVIVVGDYGESLGEHGYYFSHGGRTWEQIVHVPMIVRWPGRFEGGTRDDGLRSITSVAPLLRQAAGLEPVTALAPERSVLIYTTGADGGRGPDAGPVEGATGPAAAIRYPGGKLVAHPGEAVVWYDLVADPKETNPLPVPEHLAADRVRLEQVVAGRAAARR